MRSLYLPLFLAATNVTESAVTLTKQWEIKTARDYENAW